MFYSSQALAVSDWAFNCKCSQKVKIKWPFLSIIPKVTSIKTTTQDSAEQILQALIQKMFWPLISHQFLKGQMLNSFSRQCPEFCTIRPQVTFLISSVLILATSQPHQTPQRLPSSSETLSYSLWLEWLINFSLLPRSYPLSQIKCQSLLKSSTKPENTEHIILLCSQAGIQDGIVL